jgi:hypothetical protein
MTAHQEMTSEELTARRQRLVEQLGPLQDFTPGSFQEEWGRCGKPGCHCAREGDRGHGPHRSVLRYRAGKTVKRAVPPGAAPAFRDKVARWDEFGRVCAEIADIGWELSMRELDLAGQGRLPGVPSGRDTKKGGSRRRISTGSKTS